MGLNHCKLNKNPQVRLVEFFVLEVTARSAADVLGIQPNTAALFYRKLRQLIADQLALVEHEVFDGSVELDESYFGGMRKGKRGRGAAGKVIVFGLLKRREGLREGRGQRQGQHADTCNPPENRP